MTQVWKACFGKPADGIEKSVEKEDECESIVVCSLDKLLMAQYRRHDY